MLQGLLVEGFGMAWFSTGSVLSNAEGRFLLVLLLTMDVLLESSDLASKGRNIQGRNRLHPSKHTHFGLKYVSCQGP